MIIGGLLNKAVAFSFFWAPVTAATGVFSSKAHSPLSATSQGILIKYIRWILILLIS